MRSGRLASYTRNRFKAFLKQDFKIDSGAANAFFDAMFTESATAYPLLSHLDALIKDYPLHKNLPIAMVYKAANLTAGFDNKPIADWSNGAILRTRLLAKKPAVLKALLTASQSLPPEIAAVFLREFSATCRKDAAVHGTNQAL